MKVIDVALIDRASCIEDTRPNWKFIEEKQVYFDTEKKYVEYEAILLNMDKNQYYKTTYQDWGTGETTIDEAVLTPVTRKTKTIHYYE